MRANGRFLAVIFAWSLTVVGRVETDAPSMIRSNAFHWVQLPSVASVHGHRQICGTLTGDCPRDDFTLHIWGSLAEQKRKMISERTKAGLKRSSGTAADPALLLEARLQLRADLLGNLLDAALDRVAAA